MRRDAVNGKKIVVDDLGLVSGEFHLLDAPVKRDLGILNKLEFIVFGLGFVVNVEVCESLACLRESPEVFGEGDVRQVALEVRLILLE